MPELYCIKLKRPSKYTVINIFSLLVFTHWLLGYQQQPSHKSKLYLDTRKIGVEINKMPIATHPHTWVSAHPIGRLGNQLFISASSYGIAKKRGAGWCLDDVEYLNSVVDWLQRPQLCPSDHAHFQIAQDTNKHGVYTRSFIEDNANSSLKISEYLQSFKYFTDLPFKLKTQNWGVLWAEKHKITTGIHIRRGDYLTSEYHKGLTPPTEYYAAAIKYLNARYNTPNINVFVTSDDLEWVQNQEMFNGMTLSQSTFKPEEDMAILSACQNMVLSAGTFSWWSAYFSEHSNGLKIYYSEPDKEIFAGSKIIADYYPHNWIGLNNDHIKHIISQEAGQKNKQCPITWVTSYFDIPSKHTHANYMLWIDNLFSMKLCLVIFTDNKEVIQKAQMQNHLAIEVDLEKEISINLNFSHEFWNSQLHKDPEKNIHQSYKLYWVWALKSFFLDNAVATKHKTGFNSEFFFWIDSGLMRDSQYLGKDITSANPNLNKSQVYFGLVNPWQESFPDTADWCQGPSFLNIDRLMGGIFGCHFTMVKTWLQAYLEVMSQYIKCGFFIGKDQSIMNTVCLRYNDLCQFISTPHQAGNWHSLRQYIMD